MLLRQTDIGVFLSAALNVSLLVFPWVALIGGVSCIVFLFLVDHARWTTIIALILELGFVCFGLSSIVSAVTQAHAKRGYFQKLDEKLVGTIDRENGVYLAPGGIFQVTDERLRRVPILDMKNEGKKSFKVLFQASRSPQWSIEVSPVADTGVPNGSSPEEFAKFVERQAGGENVLDRAVRITPGGPVCRVVFKRKISVDRGSEIWMSDHLQIGGWWYRISVIDLAGPNPDEDTKLLAENMEQFWKGLKIAPAQPQIPEAPKPASPFSVPDSLSTPLDQEKWLKVPDSATLSR